MADFQIMIPESDLPAHIVNSELARRANEDAAAGISSGYAARIKMSGKQFALVDGGGTETPVKAKELVEGPDENSYLKTVVLAAKRSLQKRFYLTKYDPSKDGVAPDCFSNDGERPDASIPTPQCDTCAACAMNAFGSGSNENGAATAGKACTDNKMLAVNVFARVDDTKVANKGVHELKITPASLKNWGLYVKALTSRGISVGNVFTLVGFDAAASFPVLQFQYGGALPPQAVEKLAALSQTVEVQEIINQKITFSTKAVTGAPSAAPVDLAAEKKKKAELAAAKKKADAEKAAAAAAEKAAASDDLGLGLDDDLGLGAETAKETAGDDIPGSEISDDELANELGL